MKTKPRASTAPPSELITQRIAELGDWRGKLLARMRTLIKQAEPGISEEWKWRATPVWVRYGGICTGETYKSVVKLTFFKGASLKDPAKLFNSSLEGNTRRAIDFHETDKVNEAAFKELIRAAVAANVAGKKNPVTSAAPKLKDGDRSKTRGKNGVVKKGKA